MVLKHLAIFCLREAILFFKAYLKFSFPSKFNCLHPSSKKKQYRFTMGAEKITDNLCLYHNYKTLNTITAICM